jgi:hypothetical protein
MKIIIVIFCFFTNFIHFEFQNHSIHSYDILHTEIAIRNENIILASLYIILNYSAFKSLEHERAWWRLFQTCVEPISFDIYVFINIQWNLPKPNPG